jgi:hypothetical protein
MLKKVVGILWAVLNWSVANALITIPGILAALSAVIGHWQSIWKTAPSGWGAVDWTTVLLLCLTIGGLCQYLWERARRRDREIFLEWRGAVWRMRINKRRSTASNIVGPFCPVCRPPQRMVASPGTHWFCNSGHGGRGTVQVGRFAAKRDDEIAIVEQEVAAALAAGFRLPRWSKSTPPALPDMPSANRSRG